MARARAVHAVTDDKALGGALFEKSVRLDRHNTKYFYRTPSSAGNRKTYTFSAWIKRTLEGSTNPIFNRYTANNEAGFLGLYFNKRKLAYLYSKPEERNFKPYFFEIIFAPVDFPVAAPPSQAI